MKQVQKKSADKAVNAILIQAKRSGVELAWDRAESQQPQCGFGRLNLCCTDCGEGPCRINPFDESEAKTVCGRARNATESDIFLRKVSDGAAALMLLAGACGEKNASTVITTADEMVGTFDMTSRMKELGQSAAQSLQAINKATDALAMKAPPTLKVNLGALCAEMPNILVYGHVSPGKVKGLLQYAAQISPTANILGVCGGEGEGLLSIATNYVSQEIPLLTKAVDVLLVGPQCVMPATLELAAAQGTTVIYEKNLHTPEDLKKVVDQAVAAFSRRTGKATSIPGEQAMLHNAPGRNGNGWAQTLVQQVATANSRGLAFLGGCGRVGQTQDKEFVMVAEQLMNEGWRVVSAGCAGAALAKAGLCKDGEVVYLGSCHDAGRFLELVQAAGVAGVATRAEFREVTHNKVLATAVAFAVNEVATRIDQGDACWPDDVGCNGYLKAVEN